tara:strand:- start:201 stop:1064 length:864 start_codon:yes stop_codon:yes gene_type:complete
VEGFPFPSFVGFVILAIINHKLFKMKNILLLLILFTGFTVKSQDWSSVYRVVEEITLNDGLEEQYLEFEKFWQVVKEQQIKDGKLVGWFIWKVDPASNDNPWAEYLVYNVYKDKLQMEEMQSKSVDWWLDYIASVHKGKTKRSVIKKYIKETQDNKYRKKSVVYTLKGLGATLAEGAAPQAGMKGTYIRMEELSDDYVDFEINYFAPKHFKNNSRLYWDLNEIIARSENAYKQVSHVIFEVVNPDRTEGNNNGELSFEEKMTRKYGYKSRNLLGYLQADLKLFSWIY